MSPERHFEMIVSGRQLAGLIALLAAALLLAFGLGVWVGLMQPGRAPRAEAYLPSMQAGSDGAVRRENAIVPVGGAPAPSVTPAEGGVALPPVLPADVAAATPPAVATAEPRGPSPEPRAPGPASPHATPAPKPTATPRSTPTPRATATPAPEPRPWVQIAALGRVEQAEGVRQRVIALGFRAEQVLVLPGTGGKYRVRLGPFPDQESAGRVVARLHESGFPDAFTLKE